jgi:hypothetical protein
MVFTTMARTRMARGSVCTASMALSVPCPSASGANLYTSNADISAPLHTTSGMAHGRSNPLDPGSPPSPNGFGM